MRHLKWIWFLTAILIIALGVAACGNDEAGDSGDPPQDSAATEATGGNALSGGAPILDAGPGLNLNTGDSGSSALPGCSDPSDDECPMPLVMDLDGEASAGGVTIGYPARYFDVTTGDGDILFTITPSANNKFKEKATFEVYFATSVEAALAELDEPESVPWSAGTLEGTINVVRDTSQDPPVNTTIGAFALADGRAVVVRLTTTGKYGWDLWSQVYTAMLETLAVTLP